MLWDRHTAIVRAARIAVAGGDQNQAASHGFTTYFMPLNVGGSKSFSNDYTNFTCCHGTGMESPTKFQDSIYFFSGDTLYVKGVPFTIVSPGLTQPTSMPT